MNYRSLFVTLFGLFSLSLIISCQHQESAPQKASALPAVTVHVATVAASIAPQQAEVVGTVEALHKALISAKITGNIIELPVSLGSKVKQGDLLAELAANEINAQVQQARAQLEQTRRNLTRERNLLQKKAATPESVKSLEDAEKIANAGYQEALTMATYTKILAPFSGIITKKIANVGDLATPGKILLQLETEHDLQVLTDIPEKMMHQLAIGDELQVKIPSLEQTFAATVTEVSPIADPSSRTVPIKLQLPANAQLRSGQFARVCLANQNAKTLAVPTSAVVVAGQMEKVFVAEKGKARLRLVRTGSSFGEQLEVLSGLAEGEQVIVSDNQSLIDDQPITVD
jgi:RND family efflux transporter MFP subunit